MKSQSVHRHAAPVRRKGGAASQNTRWLLRILRSFLLGIGCCLLLLCGIAWLFERTTLPLTLVRPAACFAAAIGVYISGMDLARACANYKLLIGLACGVFYCLCLFLAALMAGGLPIPDSGNLSLAAAVLLSGTAGGATAALRQPASPRRN